MRTFIIIMSLGYFSIILGAEMQDSTQTGNREQNQKQIQEQNQRKNQGDEYQLRDRNSLHSGEQYPDKEGKKRSKDVFIDKDGDGLADTRAGGMGLNKIRKRTRSGNQGGSGHGGNGNMSSGNQGGK